MIDEDKFGALLHRATATLEPPTQRLVSGGIARGRRRHRLVRTGQALSGAALVAGVAVLAVALLPDGSRPQPSTTQFAGQPSASAPVSATQVADPTAGPRFVATTPQALLRAALDTLPRKGHTGTYTGRAFDGFVGTEFVYNDGHGAAQIDVAIEYGASAEPAAQYCADARSMGVKLDCKRRPDGSTLATHKGYSRPGDPSTAREWTADLFRADGVHVSLSEWNSAQEKDKPTTRPAPPFTIAELTKWISGRQWSTRATVEQVRAAIGLFTPDPSPDGTMPTSATSSTPTNTDDIAASCAAAAKSGRTSSACAPPTHR